ncbi:ABC transporter ATP-binding protein [Nesterenkonia lutea]|uniref:ABC-2 type transport system ATP-binding protein n=1 Tax=Nesterenkonia lutea TaxID=272919 RepID=A0ABR9JDC1_9MICC|nr:ATP-binding cassette domain-containing protein [Nesterenkonia lutea]MBE1523928.1 ABC-2 type transport system ATP-binding protein [Nesterenkonia lutea]
MTTSPAIQISSLARSFGSTQAVAEVSFSAEPGRVLALLGPNGAGKTTTMRMLLGLVRPDSGHALIEGLSYAEIHNPAGRIGAVLDAGGLHPDRTARQHLAITAAMIGATPERVSQMLQEVGLAEAADRAVRGYSLGMRQRLALANALLGEPTILVLDEPANGLDPAGIRWLRQHLRGFAARGGTVLISTHVLSEAALVADDVVIIDRGRSLLSGALDQLTTDRDLEQLYLSMTSTSTTPTLDDTTIDQETLR